MQVAGSEDAAAAPSQGSAPPAQPQSGAPATPGWPDGVDGADEVAADSLTVPLPEIRTSYRAKRRHERRRVQRQRVWVVAGILFAIAAIVGVLVANERPDAPAGDTDGDLSATPAGQARPVLLAQPGPDGRAVSLTVLVPAAGGEGGTVLLVPAGTMTEVPGLGPQPVGRSLALGGTGRLLSTVRNLLGASIEDAVLTDDRVLADLLEATGPLRLDLPERVEQVDDDGLVTVLFEAGPVELQPSEAGLFLSARGSGTDLARMARHQVFWEAWIAALRSADDRIPHDPQALGAALDALAGGEVGVRLLPVESFGSTPQDGELYTATEGDVAEVVDEVFGGQPGGGPRPRVRVLNGTGALELARQVTERLEPADVQVTLTGNAEPFGYERTEIIYYDPANRAVAERIRETLGVGVLVRNRNETGVVDVTIIVGKDFRAE